MAADFLVFLIGLALGSFLNVVITRLPQGETVWAGRSRCPWCRTPLPWYDNLPLLSYFRLRGRCRFCQAAIALRYPLVEFIGGVLALALWFRFPEKTLLLVYGPWCLALLALSFIDLEHRVLPDAITLPGIAAGLLLSLVLPHLHFLLAAGGALLGGAFLYGIGWVYERLTGRRGLGGGDVKMMALIGAFLGVQAVPVVIFLSAALGSLTGVAWTYARGGWRGNRWRLAAIPYGPFLAAGALIYLFWGSRLLTWWAGAG